MGREIVLIYKGIGAREPCLLRPRCNILKNFRDGAQEAPTALTPLRPRFQLEHISSTHTTSAEAATRKLAVHAFMGVVLGCVVLSQ